MGIGQCDLKHIKTLPIKNNDVSNVVNNHMITIITALPVRLDAILTILSVSNFKATVILYLLYFGDNYLLLIIFFIFIFS